MVGEYGEALILRKKTADGAFELYSDLDSKIAALEKRRSHYRSGMLGALVLVLLSGRHAYKAISQYGFSSWLVAAWKRRLNASRFNSPRSALSWSSVLAFISAVLAIIRLPGAKCRQDGQ